MQSLSTTLLPGKKRAIPIWRGLVIVLLAAVTVIACLWGTPPATKSEPGVVMELPGSLIGLWGSDQPVSESEKVILPADTEFAKKIYSDGMGNDIHCQIVLAGAEKRSIHRPEVCLPAQGWTIKSGEVVPVKLADGRTLEVMKLTVVRPVTLNNGTADVAISQNQVVSREGISREMTCRCHSRQPTAKAITRAGRQIKA
jgi:hypothetical protein